METRPSINPLVAEEIRVLLARRRLSASDLARMTGMTQRAISRRITGEKVIDVDDLQRIADALNVEVTALLPRSNEGRVVTTAGASGTNERSGHLARRLRRDSTRMNTKRRNRYPHPISRPETGTPAPTPTGPPTQRRPALIASAG